MHLRTISQLRELGLDVVRFHPPSSKESIACSYIFSRGLVTTKSESEVSKTWMYRWTATVCSPNVVTRLVVMKNGLFTSNFSSALLFLGMVTMTPLNNCAVCAASMVLSDQPLMRIGVWFNLRRRKPAAAHYSRDFTGRDKTRKHGYPRVNPTIPLSNHHELRGFQWHPECHQTLVELIQE